MKNALIVISLFALSCVASAEDNPAIEAMQEYMEFAEYAEGSISPDQLASIDASKIFFVDARNKGQFDAGHIPGAINIEWRNILERRNEIPSDRSVIIYCETGLLSSKAQFALKIAGRDNVKVLRGGFSAFQRFQEAQKQEAKTIKQIGDL